MTKFQEFCKELEEHIESTYTTGTTVEEAERLAAKFLHAQLKVSVELQKADLDSRMRKSGVKAIQAAVYMEAATSGDKKPTEAALGHIIAQHDVVNSEQTKLDEAEVIREELKRYYDIFGNAHIYYRTISKGSFGG